MYSSLFLKCLLLLYNYYREKGDMFYNRDMLLDDLRKQGEL